MKPVRMVISLVLIALGVLGLLDLAGVLNAGDVIGHWWPVALIALGVFGMIGERRVSLGPVVLTGIGIVLLIDALDKPDTTLALWAGLAIGVGVWFGIDAVWGRGMRGLSRPSRDTVAIFGGSEVRPPTENFEHADVAAVFGAATLDLRHVRFAPGARVDALALFGGVDVLVPRGCRVALRGLPLFGGFEDKTIPEPLSADAPVLTVVCTAIFGGVDVKNTKHGEPAVPIAGSNLPAAR